LWIASVGRAEYSLHHRPLQQPAGLLLGWRWGFDVMPLHMIHSGNTGCFDRRLVVAKNSEEIAIADELDRPLGGAPDGIFID
jgi:hypothetical protein